MLTCCVANCKSCASDVGFIANEDFRSLPPLSDRLVLSQTRIFGPNPAPSHRIDLAKNRKNSELGKIKQMRIFGPPPTSPPLYQINFAKNQKNSESTQNGLKRRENSPLARLLNLYTYQDVRTVKQRY